MVRLTSIILFFSFQFSFAQFNIQHQDPKTPEVYLFEKYGSVPISKHNGRQNLSVTLHNIKYGDINIPLNIFYNSNGIRVDEEASRVGLGWYFGVGMISQTIMGKNDLDSNVDLEVPDFYNTPYPQFAVRPYPTYEHSINTPGPAQDPNRLQLSPTFPDKDSYAMIRLRSEGCESVYSDQALLFPRGFNNNNPGNFHDYNDNLRNKFDGADTERDIFRANFLGHSIMFHLSGANNSGFRIMNGDKYVIAKSYDSSLNKFSWIITDPSGIKYYFDEELVSNNSDFTPQLNLNIGITQNTYETFNSLMNTSYNPRQSGYNYLRSRSWKITKIKDTKGNEVTFEYESLPIIKMIGSISGKLNFRNTTTTTNTNAFGTHISGFPISDVDFASKSTSTLILEKSILKRINYSNSKVEFLLGSRADIPYDKRVEKVEVFEANEKIKNIDFQYSYFNTNHQDNTQKRLKLDQVVVADKKYSFNYEGNFMPDKNSLSFDYWGFYNGMPNETVASDPFRFYEDTNNIPSWVRSQVSNIDGKGNSSAHPDNCKVGMLKKITYPTGGATEFIYELNTFDNYYFPNFDNKLNYNGNSYNTDYTQNQSQGYGLRIKETIDYTELNVISSKKRYTYAGGKHIPPQIFKNEDYYKRSHFYTSYGGNAPISTKYHISGPQISVYSNTIFQTGLLGNGDWVGYDSVIVENLDLNNNSNGKTIYYYTNVPDKNPRNVFGQGGATSNEHYDRFGYSIRTTDVDNGLLTKQEIYNSQNDTLLKTEYTYQSIVPFSSDRLGINSNIAYNVKNTFVGSLGYVELPLIYCNYYEHMFYFYPLKKTKTLLKTKKVTNYFDSNSIANLKTYTYNSYNLPTGFNLKDSEGNIFKEQTKTLTSYSAPNIYTYPKSITDKENGLIVSQLVSTYNTSNDYELTRVDYYPRGNGDPNNKKYLYYDLYDSKGNINQLHTKDGIYTTYIWGYDKRYPIAKIENATYSQISSQVVNLQTLSNADNDRTIGSTGNEGALRDALNNLRNLSVLLPSAMVTTYTYDPLIGVTSITDPKGYTMYYEYDDFNRLKQVKDADGKILSENDYHYKGQQ